MLNFPMLPPASTNGACGAISATPGHPAMVGGTGAAVSSGLGVLVGSAAPSVGSGDALAVGWVEGWVDGVAVPGSAGALGAAAQAPTRSVDSARPSRRLFLCIGRP